MVKNTLSRASLALLLAWGSSYAAEPAGRVLLLQGSANAVRGAQEVQLARGVSVETGDLLRVAEGSSLQVRFTDESVVALRANTQFKIEDYKFSENGTGDKSIFSLLKGGLRTITGLIGKRSPQAYALRGVTATIGIRGTHFTAVNCAGDCTNANGTPAEDGLYGGVTDGRIVVTNQAGESEFGRDQYFVVTSSNSLPKSLLAPPSFLRDRLDGLAKAPKGGQGKAAEAGSSGSSSVVESTSPVVGVGTNVVAGSLPTSPFAPANSPLAGSVVKSEAIVASQPTVPYSPANSLAAASTVAPPTTVTGPTVPNSPPNSPAVPPVVVPPTAAAPVVVPPTAVSGYSFMEIYSIVETRASTVNGLASYGVDGSFQTVDTVTNFPVSKVLDFYLNPFTGTSSDTDQNGVTDSSIHNKAASVGNGSFTGVEGTVYWGRYQEVRDQSLPTVESQTGWNHWLQGAPVTAMPTSGTFTFSHVGGTQPTDQFGNVGTLTSGGAWTINFAALTIQSAAPVAWAMAGASYTVNVASPVALTTQTSTTTGTQTTNGMTGTGTWSSIGFNQISGPYITCVGCTAPNVTISAQGMGATATMLGVGIASSASVAGVTQTTAQVQAYKR